MCCGPAGDAPLRYATVHMFFDAKTEVEHFCGMRYWHQALFEPTCACDDNDTGGAGVAAV